MNLETRGFTKTQMKMLKVLADGEPHPRKELEDCLPDELNDRIDNHLTAMRKLLRPQGQTILCVVNNRRYWYCWTQLCPPAYEALMQSKRTREGNHSMGPGCVF